MEYALYIGGQNVEIEVTEAAEGSRHKNNLKVAFEAMGVAYVDRSQILELQVKIVTEAEIVKDGADRI